jgi:hypothetical protein
MGSIKVLLFLLINYIAMKYLSPFVNSIIDTHKLNNMPLINNYTVVELETFPGEIKQYFIEAERDLIEAGFEKAKNLFWSDSENNLECFYSVLVSPLYKDMALVSYERNIQGDSEAGNYWIQICSEFEDTSEVVTNNDKTPSFWLKIQGSTVIQLPSLAHPNDLYTIHRNLVKKLFLNKRKYIPQPDKIIFHAIESINKHLQIQANKGLMYFDNNINKFRFTWWGAFRLVLLNNNRVKTHRFKGLLHKEKEILKSYS